MTRVYFKCQLLQTFSFFLSSSVCSFSVNLWFCAREICNATFILGNFKDLQPWLNLRKGILLKVNCELDFKKHWRMIEVYNRIVLILKTRKRLKMHCRATSLKTPVGCYTWLSQFSWVLPSSLCENSRRDCKYVNVCITVWFLALLIFGRIFYFFFLPFFLPIPLPASYENILFSTHYVEM